MENLTGKALAEYLLIHPEYANSECPWHTLCLTDWAKVLKVHPQLEQFRPQLPAESPYILLSVTEILDLHREFMENLKNAKKMDLCMINSENNPEYAVYHRQKPKQTAGENPGRKGK